MSESNNNITDLDAIAPSCEVKKLQAQLTELKNDNQRLSRMIKQLTQQVAFTSNLNEVYARMIETQNLGLTVLTDDTEPTRSI